MSHRVVECVPNFSEGRDMAKIKVITDAIEAVPAPVGRAVHEAVDIFTFSIGQRACARAVSAMTHSARNPGAPSATV